jgi:hypothetical protein
MMQYDNSITRNIVKHAVSECGKLFWVVLFQYWEPLLNCR